jgi:hypothetical protein
VLPHQVRAQRVEMHAQPVESHCVPEIDAAACADATDASLGRSERHIAIELQGPRWADQGEAAGNVAGLGRIESRHEPLEQAGVHAFETQVGVA